MNDLELNLLALGTEQNGTKLSYICMNPGDEPGTVGNDTPSMVVQHPHPCG